MLAARYVRTRDTRVTNSCGAVRTCDQPFAYCNVQCDLNILPKLGLPKPDNSNQRENSRTDLCLYLVYISEIAFYALVGSMLIGFIAILIDDNPEDRRYFYHVLLD